MNLPILIPVSLLSILFVMGCSPSHTFAQTQTLPDEPMMRSREEIPKRDILYLASEAYLAGGTTVDMKFTLDGLNHLTTAETANGTVLADVTTVEGEWPGSMWKRNAGAVVMANVVLNTGFGWLDRRLYRGGHRRIAITMNVLKGTCNWVGAIHNIVAIGNIDKRVRLETGYTGPILWAP